MGFSLSPKVKTPWPLLRTTG